jgi:hypothetical protein
LVQAALSIPLNDLVSSTLQFLMKQHPEEEKPLVLIEKACAAVTSIDITNNKNLN